jgi:hypothetical protein
MFRDDPVTIQNAFSYLQQPPHAEGNRKFNLIRDFLAFMPDI